MAAVEKIIAFSFVLLQIFTGGDKCEDLITSNLIKHLSAKKQGKVYKTDIFSEGKRSETEIKEIFQSQYKIMHSLLIDIGNVYISKKKQFAHEAFQVLILNLVLNIYEKNIHENLRLFLSKHGELLQSKLIIALFICLDWGSLQDLCGIKKKYKENPDLLNLSKNKTNPDDFSFEFTVQILEYNQNPQAKPNIEKLERESIQESKEIATHLILCKTLKKHKLRKDKIKNLKKGFTLEKYDLMYEIKSKGHKLENDKIKKFWNNKKSVEYLKLIDAIKEMHFAVVNTFYKTSIFNVLDAHYLFSLLEQIDERYIQAIHLIGNAIEEKKEDENAQKEFGDFIGKMKEELKIWKSNKFMPDEEYLEKKKKVYKTKWEQHRRKLNKQKVGPKQREALLKKMRDIRKNNAGVLI